MTIINSNQLHVNKYKYSPLVEQWSQFVSKYPWDWWVTLTFRESKHPEAAAKLYDTFIHTLNKEIFGNRYYKKKIDGVPIKGVIWCRGTEKQKNGNIHYHVLIGRVPNKVRRFDYIDYWNHIAGFANIFKYEPGCGGEKYLAKSCYLFKHGEIDLGGPLSHYSQEKDSDGLFS